MPGMKEQITLIGATLGTDAYQTKTAAEKTVYAEKMPNYGAEFTTANAGGYDLQHTMKIHGYEYSGEKSVRYNGQEYKVYRTYQPNDDWVILYLSTKSKKAGT